MSDDTIDKFDPDAFNGSRKLAVPELSEEEAAKAKVLERVLPKYLGTLNQGEKLAIKRRYEVKDFASDADVLMIVCARQKGRGMAEYGPKWDVYERMTDDEIVDFLVEGEQPPADDGDTSPTDGAATPSESESTSS